jgi:Fe2+ transport system protein FeoA
MRPIWSVKQKMRIYLKIAADMFPDSSPSPAIPLCDLRIGDTARVHRTSVDANVARFLRAVGLTNTSEFRLCKAGEPCIIQVRSTRIGLSRAVADRIFVVPIARERA